MSGRTVMRTLRDLAAEANNDWSELFDCHGVPEGQGTTRQQKRGRGWTQWESWSEHGPGDQRARPSSGTGSGP